jgi:hypothetical protein
MLPEEVRGERILFGCLDWGSGHVARSIPLIRRLQSQENEVIVWCSESQRSLFGQYLPAIRFIIGFAEDFRFSGSGDFTKELLRNSRRQFLAMRRERKKVHETVQRFGITLIISDHRYGMFSPDIRSIFLTHQVRLPSAAGKAAQFVHRMLMRKFAHIWIADDERERLAGALSERVSNSAYIGLLSRFDGASEKTGGIVAIVSGPSPYNEQFYAQLVSMAGEGWTIIAPESLWKEIPRVLHIANWGSADDAIRNASLVISRPGYSTLMDLHILGTKAILLPTPGQLEQEYLAAHHKHNSNWKFAHSPEELGILISDASK